MPVLFGESDSCGVVAVIHAVALEDRERWLTLGRSSTSFVDKGRSKLGKKEDTNTHTKK